MSAEEGRTATPRCCPDAPHDPPSPCDCVEGMTHHWAEVIPQEGEPYRECINCEMTAPARGTSD